MLSDMSFRFEKSQSENTQLLRDLEGCLKKSLKICVSTEVKTHFVVWIVSGEDRVISSWTQSFHTFKMFWKEFFEPFNERNKG